MTSGQDTALGAATARVRAAYARIAEVDRPEAWITLRQQDEVLAEAALIDARAAAGEELPLCGTVFAVKDNIDVAGLPTTAACPSFGYVPGVSAPAVSRLTDQGAVVLGKTNLDQFATGLVGTRSPYGAVRCVSLPDRVSGGSSSGSAVVVALGITDLALGTDTAGSGRIPAAFQGIVGFKPTIGLIPTAGVVPAVRPIDCVSVFASTVTAAEHAVAAMTGPAVGDPRCRTWPPDAPLAAPPAPRIAIPADPHLAGLSASWRAAFDRVVQQLAAGGADVVTIDLTPFLQAGQLLYGGAFVAERFAAVGAFLDSCTGTDAVDPNVRAIVSNARFITAHELIRDTERLDHLRLSALHQLGTADVLLVPTAPEHPLLAEVAADPIGVNSRLGTYTSFVNLLDLSAVAVPAGMADDSPFGITVVARAFADRVAADIARRITGEPPPAGSGNPVGLPLVVVGAHMSGEPLNAQLSSRGARLVGPVRTAAEYRMYALEVTPAKPGLVRVGADGHHIAGELWLLPPARLGEFLSGLPAPMVLGKVLLDDGSTAVGFLCEPYAVVGALDISHHGDWRTYRATRPDSTDPP